MPLHDFILPKSDTNSTVFDFLVIFCSFYVYSLVPGVWHFFISGLYLISTIRPESKRRAFQSKVSMPSRAYTSFLRYPFKNLGFMRFPEPVFAGIYQNILTTAVFRAC